MPGRVIHGSCIVYGSGALIARNEQSARANGDEARSEEDRRKREEEDSGRQRRARQASLCMRG